MVTSYSFLVLTIVLIIFIVVGLVVLAILSNGYFPFKKMKKKEMNNCYMDITTIHIKNKK